MSCKEESSGGIGIISIIINFLMGFLKKELKACLSLFGKSLLLLAFEVAAVILLDKFLSTLKDLIQKKVSRQVTDDEILVYVKNNRQLQKIINIISIDINETTTSTIILGCDNKEYYENQSKKIIKEISTSKTIGTGNTYIEYALLHSDFDEETDNLDISKLNILLNKIEGILPFLFLIAYLILKIKDLFTRTYHPSKYRAKYLQRLIRFVGAIFKTQIKGSKKDIKTPNNINKTSFGDLSEITTILDGLKIIDAIIIASLSATLIYLNNRKKHRDLSSETLAETTKYLTCKDQTKPPFDVLVKSDNSYLKNDNLLNNLISKDSSIIICPIEETEPFVPHEPFELKKDLSRLNKCEIIQNSTPITDINIPNYGTSDDLATKALIENKSTNTFNILVKSGQQVNSRTALATFGGSRIYSPIDGIVTNIDKQKIFLGNIRDPKTSYINDLIVKLQELYKELNNTKYFIKDFFIECQYPHMLSLSASKSSQYEGMQDKFTKIKTTYINAKKDYEKKIRKITGKNNVKKKSENKQLSVLKTDVDNADKAFYKQLLTISGTGESDAVVTLAKEEEFTLIEYYFTLLQNILSVYDQNEIIKPFRDGLNTILLKRYFIDQWDQTTVENRINSMCNELLKGTYLQNNTNIYDKMMSKYNSSHSTKKVKDYVKKLGNKNTTITEDDKQKLVDKIMFLFNFNLQLIRKINNKFNVSPDKHNATKTEANFIDGYFNKLWKRYNKIPREINNVIKTLNDLGYTPTTYSIIEIDDEQYRYYGIGKNRECPVPKEENDDYTSPFSSYGYGDIEYWLKYCSFATLASVTNPTLGWSTGLPPPIGPTPFPVIYIPIKPFQMDWGFMVIGISICGIYIYPWVLIANLSTNHHVPFIDPASVIKASIDVLKNSLSLSLKNFKNVVLKGYMNDTKKDLIAINKQIVDLRTEQRIHRTLKPKQGTSNYNQDLSTWNDTELFMAEQLLVLKTKKFILETKYKIVYDAYSGGCVEDYQDPTIKSIEQTDKQNAKQFSLLKKLVNSIELLIMPLPNAAKPVSANFLFTIKNPTPLIKIATNLNNNIDSGALDKIIESYKLKNDDFMNPNFENKSNNSITNWKKYTSDLKLAMFTLIISDPFPKYENLKVTNIPWILFLYNNWAPTGATTYGFPGFPPFPIPI